MLIKYDGGQNLFSLQTARYALCKDVPPYLLYPIQTEKGQKLKKGELTQGTERNTPMDRAHITNEPIKQSTIQMKFLALTKLGEDPAGLLQC